VRRLLLFSGLLALTAVLVLLTTRPASLPDGALPRQNADISNGERIFHAGGCASCHSSTAEYSEPAILGGGLTMDTPFGKFRVPNISPHTEHGIGNWTTLDFANAMLLGTSPDGRHYYPAFPYASYSRMSIGDVIDLKAFLDTLPAVDDQSEDHSLKFPWSIRIGIGLWKLINLDPAFVSPVAAGDQQLMLGRYLVEGPGHCAECHTPRNWSGGLDASHWLAGAPNPDGEGKVPNITPGDSGLADWSEGDIEYYLASGFTPDFDTVGSSMVKVQENMARLSKEDRVAIAAYLKSVPPLD
jgi:mono/diheme cytochrome c family protein